MDRYCHNVDNTSRAADPAAHDAGPERLERRRGARRWLVLAAGAIGPGARPVQLSRGEPGRVDPYDHVVFGCVGVRDVGERKPGGASGLVSRDYSLHNDSLLRPVQVLACPGHPAGQTASRRISVCCLAGSCSSL